MRKKIILGTTILLLIIFLFLLTIDGYKYYQQWSGERRVEKMAEELRKLQEEIYNQRTQDKIGGKTPQETLQMFIEAVERGDYDLASKYFVIEKQEEAKSELLQLKEKNNINWYLEILKNAKTDGEIINGSFRMKSKTELGPYYFIRFILYPSGNWKIEEI